MHYIVSLATCQHNRDCRNGRKWKTRKIINFSTSTQISISSSLASPFIHLLFFFVHTRYNIAKMPSWINISIIYVCIMKGREHGRPAMEILPIIFICESPRKTATAFTGTQVAILQFCKYSREHSSPPPTRFIITIYISPSSDVARSQSVLSIIISLCWS